MHGMEGNRQIKEDMANKGKTDGHCTKNGYTQAWTKVIVASKRH
jgi:hypothetical protein